MWYILFPNNCYIWELDIWKFSSVRLHVLCRSDITNKTDVKGILDNIICSSKHNTLENQKKKFE